MSTFTSIEIVKSVGYRRISYLVYGNLVRKYSPRVLEKSSKWQSSNYHSQKRCLAIQCPHMFLKTSGLHRFAKQRSSHPANVFENFFTPGRHYQTKSKDCNKEDDDNLETESKATNVLDDLEFQNILKGFARDFEVNEDSGKFLEEIKQGHHGTSDDETEQPPSKTECSDHQLDFKNGVEARTSNLPLSERVREFHNHGEPEVLQTEEIQEDSADEFFHIDQELEKNVEYDAKRGKEGVYDIDELVAVLREENIVDISVIQIPQVLHYSDYLVLATAKSPRHCQAVVEFLIKLYKKKKSKSDPFVKCVGKETTTWKVLDMGNIVLHVFLQDIRNFYDIESLWLLDRKYDSTSSVKSDREMDMIQQQLDFLNNLKPQ